MAEEANNITDPNQETTPEVGKTFTQADVDRIAADRHSRERKNQPAQNARKPSRNGKIAGRTSSRSTFCKTGP